MGQVADLFHKFYRISVDFLADIELIRLASAPLKRYDFVAQEKLYAPFSINASELSEDNSHTPSQCNEKKFRQDNAS